MADILHFERPYIDNRKTPEENMAVIDRWATELVNNLNIVLARINKELSNGETRN